MHWTLFNILIKHFPQCAAVSESLNTFYAWGAKSAVNYSGKIKVFFFSFSHEWQCEAALAVQRCVSEQRLG